MPPRPADVVSDAFDLHRRHGETVRTVVAQAIEDNRWAAVDGGIPANHFSQLSSQRPSVMLRHSHPAKRYQPVTG